MNLLNPQPIGRKIHEDFSLDDAEKVKETENVTNHDVKAIEYFVKEQLKGIGMGDFVEFVHFGLTSEDVNCTAQPLSLKEFIEKVYIPTLQKSVLAPLREVAVSMFDVGIGRRDTLVQVYMFPPSRNKLFLVCWRTACNHGRPRPAWTTW